MAITADEDLYSKGRGRWAVNEHGMIYDPSDPLHLPTEDECAAVRAELHNWRGILEQARWDEVTKGLTERGRREPSATLAALLADVAAAQEQVLRLDTTLRLIRFNLRKAQLQEKGGGE